MNYSIFDLAQNLPLYVKGTGRWIYDLCGDRHTEATLEIDDEKNSLLYSSGAVTAKSLPTPLTGSMQLSLLNLSCLPKGLLRKHQLRKRRSKKSFQPSDCKGAKLSC